MPEQAASWLGKNISEMVSEDTFVAKDGTVNGTLNYVTNFEAFNSAVPAEQEGHYFPFKLTQTGTKMTFYKNGSVSKPNLNFDPEILFRIDDNSTTWKVEVDGAEVITLNFAKATLAPKA